jgi:hypothetical protein
MITPVEPVHQDHHRRLYEAAGAILCVGVMVWTLVTISSG